MSEIEDEKKPILAESDSESESMMDSDDECSDGEESVDEELTTEQVMRKEMAGQENLSGHVWDDFKNSVWTSRYMCLMGAFIGFVMALQFTVTPYRAPSHMFKSSAPTWDELHDLRPILTPSDLVSIKKNTMHAETEFYLSDSAEYGHDVDYRVKLAFQKVARHGGHHKAPDMFYEGVVYGLGAQDSHKTRHGRTLTEDHHSELEEALALISPKPTSVIRRRAGNAETGWTEDGFAVYYSFDDLKKHGKLSADVLKPWSRIESSVMAVARRFKQVCLFRWHPNTFGKPSDEEVGKMGRHRRDFTSIIQDIVPTRTGMNELKSSVVVWTTQVNSRDVTPKPTVTRKEWTKNDHWSHYSKKNNK